MVSANTARAGRGVCMIHDGKKVVRSMRESECDSFERACAELVDVLNVNSMGKSPPRRATPICVERWHRWLYSSEIWFSSPDSSLFSDADVGILSLRDPAVGLAVRHEPGISWVGSTVIRTVVAVPGDRRFAVPAGTPVIGQRICLPYTSIGVQGDVKEDFYVPGSGGGLVAVKMCRARRMSRSDMLEEQRESSNRISLVLSYRLTMRYEWQVDVGEPGGASAMFPVSRAECADLFATRDALPGRSRRSALRHFVEKHARRRPDDVGGPSDVEVRRYLRGQTRFSWNGLDCEIIPPAYDAEAIEASKR